MPSTSPSKVLAPAAAPAGVRVWTLRLLGSFELRTGTQRHTKLGTRAAVALLARLCLRPDALHPRETLVDMLWPDVEPEAGRQRLRQTLSTLRQVLEPASHPGTPVIEADRVGLRLVPGSVQCDALDFERAYQRGDHETAHALYAGELLPGYFDEWIADERLRLEGLFDRLRRPAPAPPPAAAAPAHAPGRTSLPAYLSRLIGGDWQAARVKAEVSAHRLVTLMGPGGAGKTRLAVEAARSLATPPAWVESGLTQPAFDTVVFVPLAACVSTQQVLDQILMSLQLASGPSGALATLLQVLQGRRALLVLDNFEQAVDAATEAVEALGASLPLLHQLVTSRRALALPGERELAVAALDLPAPGATVAQAALSPAVSLFVERARGARTEFSLHEGNCAAVIDLVCQLEGMPLAIELAAARARSQSPAEMAATLRRAREGKASALDLLARPPLRGRLDTRHHSMQATIAWSWRLLPPALCTLLATLTVFQGGFTAEAARAVCAHDSGPAATVPQGLDELLSHSLLRASSAGGGDEAFRFGLYQPIREYAAGSLTPQGAAALRRAHRAWALAWSRAQPPTPSLIALQTEMPNLVAALNSAVADGEPDTAIAITLALRTALDEIDLPGAGLNALENAVAACTDAATRSSGLTVLGLVLFRAGRGEAARRVIEQALALAPADQPAIRARGLVMAVGVAWNGGERGDRLLQRLDEAQALARACADVPTLARIFSLRADIASQRDADFDRAAALLDQALVTWQSLDDDLNVLRMRYCIACLSFAANRQALASAQIDPVIAEARRLHAWGRLAQSLNVRGSARKRLRLWGAARNDLAESLRVAWGELALWNVAYALWNLPHALARTQQPVAAQQVAGFIAKFWLEGFGPLKPTMVRELLRVRRLATVQLGSPSATAAFEAGQRLALAEAVALALAAAA